MKKEYIAPETEAIEIDTAGMLCSSPLKVDSATTPPPPPRPESSSDDWDYEEE